MVALGTPKAEVGYKIIQCLELPEVPNVLLITPSDALFFFLLVYSSEILITLIVLG